LSRRFRLAHNPIHGPPLRFWLARTAATTGGYVEEIWTDDGGKPPLCEDCAGEVRRLEKLADELAAAPSCQERQQILDTVETTTSCQSQAPES
jgi:hypothetical protein